MSVHFLEDDHGHHSDQEHVEEVEGEDGMDHQFSLSWLGHQLDWVHPSDIPHHVKDVQERLHKSIVRQWRQAITGDPDRRIRDNMTERQVQTKIKRVDAFSFTLGVILTMYTEFIILARPESYPTFFYGILFFMMIHRFYTYRAGHEHFFMLDFCYFVQASTHLQTLSCQSPTISDTCQTWFKMNYVLTHGPISIAIVAWQNSLVFHSMDKVTSFAIHILPGTFYYLLRWNPKLSDAVDINNSTAQLANFTPLTWTEQFLNPLVFYIIWQIFYLIIHYTVIEKDPTLVTSIRHLTKDTKNPSHKMGAKLAVKLGFIKSVEEHMDPHDAKIIGMFTLFQLIFTILALIPTPLMFNYERINAIYLVMLTGAAIWNGGRFYIQVFSQRYNSKFMPRRSSIAPKTE